MCRIISIGYTLCLTLLLQTAAVSDRVFLKNGDRLTGKFTSVEKGKLAMETELAGHVTVDVNDVQTFSSDKAMIIRLEDGKELENKIETSMDGRIEVASSETVLPVSLPLDTIVSIQPVENKKPKWTGSLSGNIYETSGNTENESLSTSLDLQRRSEKDRITLENDYAYSEQTMEDNSGQETTEDWWKMRGKYDYFLTKKFYTFGEGRFERDKIAGLRRRVIPGGGAGYQWIESVGTNFSTELGLAALYEKYQGKAASDTEFSTQVAYHFDKQFSRNIKFINDLSYFPSTENMSDYYLTTTAEIRYGLTRNLFTNFQFIFDYDRSPAPDKSSTDTKYIIGIGLEF